jgi:hypothetical protein
MSVPMVTSGVDGTTCLVGSMPKDVFLRPTAFRLPSTQALSRHRQFSWGTATISELLLTAGQRRSRLTDSPHTRTLLLLELCINKHISKETHSNE